MPRASTAASTTPMADGKVAGCGRQAATGRRGSRKAARARFRSPSISNSVPTRSPIDGVREAQGRRREAGSEGSVEQSRGLMDKNRIKRPTRPDERANDRKVQGHQGPGWQIRQACGKGGRSYLGSSTPCPASRTERTATCVIAAGKSAEGIVAEGLTRGEDPNGGEASRTRGLGGSCGRRSSWSRPSRGVDGRRPKRGGGRDRNPRRRTLGSKAWRLWGRRWK